MKFDAQKAVPLMLKYPFRLTFIFIILSASLFGQEDDPAALYLTWKTDPTSTMVIDWHILPGEDTNALVRYQLEGEQNWLEKTATKLLFPNSDRLIFRAELSDLQPGSLYAFRIGKYDRTYRFETMPSSIDKEALVFAVGGDTYDRGHEARQIWMERTNKMVQKYHPKFILWGGDLAYADGKPDQVWRWYGWFDAIKNTLIDDQGKITPIVVTIGNHEVNKSVGSWGDEYIQNDAIREASAPFFYQILAFPGQPGYSALDFADYLSLIVLDTDHTNPIDGKQTTWLKKALRKRKNTPHVFPAYHVPAYPSVKPLNQRSSIRVRENWTPLFDRFNVPVVFEFHDHVFKRTPLIKDHKVDPEGTLYMGDGGWGTQLKAPKEADTVWYLDKVVRERNAMLVSLHGTNRYIRTVNEHGQIIDEYPVLFEQPEFELPFSSLLPNGGIILSAELAKREGKVFVDSDFSGYSYGGFAWFDKTNDLASLQWKVPFHRSDNYTVRFRYSHPGPEPARLQVLMNGKIIEDSFEFAPTKKENKWKSSSLITRFFEEGNNTIEVRPISNQVAPRIDRLEVLPSAR